MFTIVNWIKTAFSFIARLSGNNPKTKLAILLFVALAVLGWATTCRASDNQSISLESGSTYVRGEAAVLAATITWAHAGPKDADYECGIVLIGSSTFEGVAQRNQAAFDCMLVDGMWKVDFGLGVAYLQNIDDYNGSHTNFALKIQYHVNDRWVLIVRHFSNLGTVSPNLGRDFIVAGYKF